MLIVETIAKIRRLFREHRSIREISREPRLSRKVVRKALRSDKSAFAYSHVVAEHQDVRPVRWHQLTAWAVCMRPVGNNDDEISSAGGRAAAFSATPPRCLLQRTCMAAGNLITAYIPT
jgi:hypothetical protein